MTYTVETINVASNTYILEAFNRGIVNGRWCGDADTYIFAPNGNFTRAEATQILWNITGRPPANAPAPFSDTVNHWGAPAIAWASEAGIVGGRGDGTFAPDEAISREDLFTLLWRFARIAYGVDNLTPTPSAGWPFPDNHLINEWAANAIMWLHAEGHVQGDGYGNVNPRNTANRTEAATIVVRFVRAVLD